MTAIDRRTLLRTGAAGSGALLLGITPGSLWTADAAPRVRRTLARNLRVPWGLAFLPNGNALVGERQRGRVYRVSRKGGKRLVGQVADVRPDAGEGGLLGLVCSPTFRADRLVYAYLTTGDENRVVTMRYARGELGDPEVVLAGIPRGQSHNGGRLAFGPDGMLYATTGDTGDRALAGDTDSLAGKILRIAPDGSVPDGNPFGNHVWTYGHRNVEGIAFDRRGRLWATEFGEHTRDELNRIVGGHDYGWPTVEGGDGPGGFHDPFVTWRPTSTCSPSGVAVVNGRAYVGALAGRALMQVRLNGKNKRRKRRFLHERFGRIRTVQAAPDGSLWITTSNRDGRGQPGPRDDRVIRLSV